jgi:hypothetical protein
VLRMVEEVSLAALVGGVPREDVELRINQHRGCVIVARTAMRNMEWLLKPVCCCGRLNRCHNRR